MAEFKDIYKQYFRDVYYFVLSLSNNEVVAEEITQETFFDALKNIDKFKGNCKLKVWLFQIAKNRYFSYYNKQKRLDLGDIPEKVGEDNTEEMILNKDESFRIHKVLHSLNEPYKEVFTLRVFGELSFAQIGEIFGKTENWTRVTFHRAKRKIQDMLKEE